MDFDVSSHINYEESYKSYHLFRYMDRALVFQQLARFQSKLGLLARTLHLLLID